MISQGCGVIHIAAGATSGGSELKQYDLSNKQVSNPKVDQSFGSGFFVISVAFKTYITGGSENKVGFWEYESQKINELENMPTEHEGHTAVVFSNDLVVISGRENANCEAYDIGNGTWSSFGSLSEPRYEATAAVMDDKIYVIGGKLSNGDFAETIEFLSKGEEWQQTAISFSISQACSVANEDQIFIFGGERPKIGEQDEIFIFDPAISMVTESGSTGVRGDFSSYAMFIKGAEGYVYSSDGDLTVYHEDSGTFTTLVTN